MERDRVSPHVAAQKEPPTSVTHFICPKSMTESTHHLVPRGYGMVCTICGCSRSELAARNGVK